MTIFEKDLFNQSICIFFISHFGFESAILALIAPVHGHCLPSFFKLKTVMPLSILVKILLSTVS